MEIDCLVWVKLDDKFHGHRKTLALFDGPCPGDSIALWTLANSWCGDQLTDGRVPLAFVRRSGLDKRAPDELVRVGFWRRTDEGFLFHDWLARNKSREQVEAERAAALERKEKGKRTVGDGSGDGTPGESANGRKRSARSSREPPANGRKSFNDPDPTRPDPDSESSGGGDLNAHHGAPPTDPQEAGEGALHKPQLGAPDDPEPELVDFEAPDGCAVTEQDARAVSRDWHRAMHRVRLTGMHAFDSWRRAYEVVAMGLAAASDADAVAEARGALCSWWWLAPDGPIRSGRLGPKLQHPGTLAKYITTDIEAAGKWWHGLSEQQRAAYLAAAPNGSEARQ